MIYNARTTLAAVVLLGATAAFAKEPVKILSNREAARWSLENFFSTKDGWTPRFAR